MPARVVSVGVAVLLGLLLTGCGRESGLDVAEGQYRLQVAGAMTDTLTGAAVLRASSAGRTGIELGAREGPGLSIEIASVHQTEQRAATSRAPVSPGRYVVVSGTLLDASSASPDSLSGVLAFLSLTETMFVATQGHLSVTHVGNGTLDGTLDLRMRERGRAGAAAPRTIRVTGALRATAP